MTGIAVIQPDRVIAVLCVNVNDRSSGQLPVFLPYVGNDHNAVPDFHPASPPAMLDARVAALM